MQSFLSWLLSHFGPIHPVLATLPWQGSGFIGTRYLGNTKFAIILIAYMARRNCTLTSASYKFRLLKVSQALTLPVL